MALLGTYIDVRTNAGLTSTDSLTFAHGLGAAPSWVQTQYISTLASATNHFNLVQVQDATNVTIFNAGSTTSPAFRVISVLAHSIIR